MEKPIRKLAEIAGGWTEETTNSDEPNDAARVQREPAAWSVEANAPPLYLVDLLTKFALSEQGFTRIPSVLNAVLDTPVFLVDLAKLILSETGFTRIPIAVLGSFVKGGQKFKITKDDLLKVVENFRRRKTGETVIDYEHASEFTEVAAGGAIPAAGWLKAMEDGPDENGVLWGRATFTAKARSMIQAMEYKYLSPVISWGARDKTTGEAQGATLSCMALVNRPFLEALPAIQLSEAWGGRAAPREQAASTKPVPRKVILADRAKGAVRVIYDDGTESVVAVEGLNPEGAVRLSDVKRGTGSGGHGEAQAALDGAVAAGKILPTQRKHYEVVAVADPEGFKTLVASMRAQGKLAGRGDGEYTDVAGVDARLDELAREKASATGVGYGQALKLVASEHPALAARKLRLQRGGE